jgi:CheY-like chemotaxis protein
MPNWFQKLAGSLDPSGEEKTAAKPAPPAVLAIDDDKQFLATLRDLLHEHGFEVYTAACGATGLRILVNGPEHLRVLLLDYKMPEFDGVETLRYVQRVHPGVKVIGLTGVPFDQLPDEFRTGVDKLISKPFRTEDLIATIEQLASPELTVPGK